MGDNKDKKKIWVTYFFMRNPFTGMRIILKEYEQIRLNLHCFGNLKKKKKAEICQQAEDSHPCIYEISKH